MSVVSQPAVFSYFLKLFFYSIFSSCSSQFSIPFFIAVEIFMDFSVWRDPKLLFCLLFEKLMSSRNASQSQFVSAGAHRSKSRPILHLELEMGNRAITSTRSIKNSNETRRGNSWRCGSKLLYSISLVSADLLGKLSAFCCERSPPDETASNYESFTANSKPMQMPIAETHREQ